MASFGSYDLALANPPESLPESALCVCGHELERHGTSWQADCLIPWCDCSGFQWADE